MVSRFQSEVGWKLMIRVWSTPTVRAATEASTRNQPQRWLRRANSRHTPIVSGISSRPKPPPRPWDIPKPPPQPPPQAEPAPPQPPAKRRPKRRPMPMGTELTITWLKNRNAPMLKSTPPSRKLKKSLIGSLEAMPSLPPCPW